MKQQKEECELTFDNQILNSSLNGESSENEVEIRLLHHFLPLLPLVEAMP